MAHDHDDDDHASISKRQDESTRTRDSIITPTVTPTTWDLVRDFMTENPVVVVMFVLVVVMMPIQDILMPHLYGKVVTAIEKSKPIVLPLVLVAVVMVVLQLYAIASDWHDAVYFPELEKFLRTRALEAQLAMHETDLVELETGSIISQVSKLPNILYKYVETFKFTLIPTAITLVFGICYFAYYDLILGLSLAVVVAVVVALLVYSSNDCVRFASARDVAFSDMLESLDDVFQNMVSILNTGANDHEQENLDRIQETYSDLTKKTMLCLIKTRGVMTPIQLAFIFVFIWRCYVMIGSRKLPTGIFVSLFFMMLHFNGDISRCVAASREMVFRKGIIDHGLQLFERPVATQGQPGGNAAEGMERRPPPSSVALAARGLTYAAGGRTLLHAVDLDVGEGEHVVVAGPVGSGKSTLLKLFMRYAVPQAGELFLKGTPYSSLKPANIRRVVGYVPQQPVLFNRSIFANIAYGALQRRRGQDLNKTDLEREVWDNIERLGLRPMFEASFPQGLQTVAGKHGSNLSGGQRQIVWLLRVMMQDPEILLLDEPTAALDPDTREKVQKVLSVMMEGRTVVMVSHDPIVIRSARRVIFLGREAGDHHH
jgi:ABC-type multidrug transport system fused ATPase/permease subunit